MPMLLLGLFLLLAFSFFFFKTAKNEIGLPTIIDVIVCPFRLNYGGMRINIAQGQRSSFSLKDTNTETKI